MMLEIFILLVLFQIKHFIADYPLQNAYMLGKMNAAGWVKPLAAHAFVHAILTILVVALVLPLDHWIDNLLLGILLGVADFIIHFTVDRIKASPKLGGRWNPTQPYFWWALGADQMAHHLTHYAFIAILVTI